MRKLISASRLQIISNLFSKKMAASMILIFGALYVALSPMNRAADSYGISINIGVLSFVLCGMLVCPVVFLSVVFVFSDLPIKNPTQQFLIARSGKRTWLLSQLLYVVFTSLLITAFILISVCIICGRRLTISGEWGKLENAIANGQIPFEYGINTSINVHSLIEYNAFEAFWLTIGGSCFTFILLGWISIFFNMFVFELAGTIVNALILLLWLVEGYFPSIILHYLSPIAWCSAEIVTKNDFGISPNIGYIWIARTIIAVLLITVSLIKVGKRSRTMELLERKRL